ncbi:PD-(D/E)XK nuclease superfamily protein [Algoriphagus ratkowskyi]|uniref:PD-(D/E)XK nuclease family protein n=1 Tax=Algoriphagus ratkowskyi TaxID=57028 RepID=A0A2W7RAR0_9BACT|nr:PD-(D/E)XK nuclease family protein [Algoriphagus ratkowskyi]PZX52787.1 PD-(D/E)XK nuclease superfamily protein [Algoriphagus ratkowskyi]TXD76270.1 PD-(D/E)XK nuclease family protein [Algoriphagus ratkowskyi]
MNSFLKNTALDLLNSGQSLKDMIIVLPNRRAGLFFTQHLGTLIDSPSWMPEIKTIEEVFYNHAGERPTDDLSLIFELYQVYKTLQPEPEDFDRFYFWGELILKDFNDLDQFLADAKWVYSNLADIKEYETDLSFLSDEQVDLISRFWKSFKKQSDVERAKFLKFWQILEQLYIQFQANLTTTGMSYSGRIYRAVAEKLNEIQKPKKRVYFLGFNAFTLAEEMLIKHYVKEFGAKIYWDLDAYYLDDKRQEAGLFFRDYRKDPVLGPTFSEAIPNRIRDKAALIKTYSIPLKINQANLVSKIAASIPSNERLEETVIILPDEQLLFPVLHSLPESIQKLNVTMGYPIRNAPIFSFLDAVLDLQRYLRVKEEGVFFYHKPITDLLSFSYLKEVDEAFVKDILKDIKGKNLVEVNAEELAKGGELFRLIFRKVESAELFAYLGELMQFLAQSLENDAVQRSYLFQAFKQLTRIRDVFEKNAPGNVRADFYLKLFRQLFREIKLPFEGEPLEGLQIMGVLESRNLDFRRVIICDVNEGSFPPGGGINSMIPFNLRRAFSLPVQEQNDAIYAYTFYRLLHQAEEVHLIYTTASDQGKAGEMSRFIQQMQVEIGVEPPAAVLVPVDLTPGKAITIQKTPEILTSLKRYIFTNSDPDRQISFSASALNSYLDCRLRFYFRYVAGLKEKEEVVTEIDASTFGSMLHKAIELLYKPDEGKPSRLIDTHTIERLKVSIPTAVDSAIVDFYQAESIEKLTLSGQLQIARAIMIKYIKAILKYDQANGDFKVLNLERKYLAGIPVNTQEGLQNIALGGFIDRVDEKDGVIRLIDYKTGKDNKKVTTIESFFDRDDKKRNKAAMQTMLYAKLFQAENPSMSKALKPGIFNIKEIYDPNFNPFLMMEKEEIQDYREFAEFFEGGLSELIGEIYNPEIPFDQTEDVKKCEYCPYKEICGR